MRGQLAAVHKVFATVELLEIILCFLPARELLLSKQISRSFRDAIKYSNRHRKALFLDLELTENTQLEAPTINPILAQHGRSRYRDIAFCMDGTAYSITMLRVNPTSNPLIPKTGKPNAWHLDLYIEELAYPVMQVGYYAPPKTLSLSKSALTGTTLSWNGSWTSMYLSDPPRPIAVMLWKRTAMSKPDANNGRPACDFVGDFEDLRAGTLDDVLQQVQCRKRAISPSWHPRWCWCQLKDV